MRNKRIVWLIATSLVAVMVVAAVVFACNKQTETKVEDTY